MEPRSPFFDLENTATFEFDPCFFCGLLRQKNSPLHSALLHLQSTKSAAQDNELSQRGCWRDLMKTIGGVFCRDRRGDSLIQSKFDRKPHAHAPSAAQSDAEKTAARAPNWKRAMRQLLLKFNTRQVHATNCEGDNSNSRSEDRELVQGDPRWGREEGGGWKEEKVPLWQRRRVAAPLELKVKESKGRSFVGRGNVLNESALKKVPLTKTPKKE